MNDVVRLVYSLQTLEELYSIVGYNADEEEVAEAPPPQGYESLVFHADVRVLRRLC